MQMASRKVIAGLMVLALCITTLSSAGSDVEAKAKASLKTKKISVKVGKKKSILIKNKTKKYSYSFTSSNKQVAKVTSKGKVTGIKAGKATITVKEVLKKGKKKKRKLGKVKVTVTGMKKKNVATPTPETVNKAAPTAEVKTTPTATPSATAPVEPTASATPAATETAAPTPIVTRSPAPRPTLAPGMPELDKNNLTVADYPGIASDVPDLDIIRVGQNYYMVSTTMNLVPGVPVMKSTDLVHWEIVNYACNRFPDKDLFNLENGKQTYKNGSWAASLKYNEKTKLFYVIYNVNNDGFYCYTTPDIEDGTWKAYYIQTSFHDPALIFDGDGMYVIYNGNNIQKISLKESSVEGGIGKVVKEGGSRALFDKTLGGFKWSLWEGAHAYKIGDYYYLMIIGSYGSWFRREVCYRSKKLYDSKASDWEAQLIFEGSTYEYGTGIAQGGIVDTIYGDWYGFLFQDHDGLGRVPSILAVNWDYVDTKNNKYYPDWPMMGYYDDKGNFVNCLGTSQKVKNPLTIQLNKSDKESYIVGDDDFSYPDFKEGDSLKKVWQWNHNPDDANWSVTENPGYYRIKNGKVAGNIWFARNSLTQRTVGPNFTSETCVLTENMKPGDYAGLAAISAHYGMVGVKCDENGNRYVFQGCNSDTNSGAKAKKEDKIKENAVSEEKIEGNAPVYLKIEYAFNTGNTRADRANFFYSLDGENWKSIGKTFSLGFDTATTFMGTRSWLVNYATKEAGGYVDFDYYKVK